MVVKWWLNVTGGYNGSLMVVNGSLMANDGWMMVDDFKQWLIDGKKSRDPKWSASEPTSSWLPSYMMNESK